MLTDFFKKHTTAAKILYFPLGVILLYGAVKYGLLGFLNGKTEIISKFSSNHPIENPWLVFLVSALSLYIGIYLGVMLIALALGYKDIKKYYQNKLFQAIFILSIFGYFLVLLLYPFLNK